MVQVMQVVSDKSMKHKIIFVGGVHGVGKTFLCKKVCEDLGIDHFSASDLIKKVRNIKFPTNKLIEGIGNNQDSLIVAVGKYVNDDKVCILDGHFCLLDSQGIIVNVPMATFTSLSPMAIIVLNDEPSNIYTRIHARDGNESGIDSIANFQESEIKYSKAISEELGIPYLLANPFSEGELVHGFIRSIT